MAPVFSKLSLSALTFPWQGQGESNVEALRLMMNRDPQTFKEEHEMIEYILKNMDEEKRTQRKQELEVMTSDQLWKVYVSQSKSSWQKAIKELVQDVSPGSELSFQGVANKLQDFAKILDRWSSWKKILDSDTCSEEACIIATIRETLKVILRLYNKELCKRLETTERLRIFRETIGNPMPAMVKKLGTLKKFKKASKKGLAIQKKEMENSLQKLSECAKKLASFMISSCNAQIMFAKCSKIPGLVTVPGEFWDNITVDEDAPLKLFKERIADVSDGNSKTLFKDAPEFIKYVENLLEVFKNKEEFVEFAKAYGKWKPKEDDQKVQQMDE